MKHIWSVLCNKGIIDKKSNNISLIEIIEEVKFVTEIKGVSGENINLIGQMPVDWVTLWVRSNIEEPEKGSVKDFIVTPSGKTNVNKEYEIDLQNFKRNRAIRRIMLPPINESGIYLFLTQLKDEQRQRWNTVAEIPLDITLGRVETK